MIAWREEIQERLNNWCRVYKDHPHWHSCMSLEGRFRCNMVWEPQEPKRAVADHGDAALIESILTGKTFPDLGRRIIVYAYIYPHSNLQAWARKLKVTHGYRINTHSFERDQIRFEEMLYNRIYIVDNQIAQAYTHV